MGSLLLGAQCFWAPLSGQRKEIQVSIGAQACAWIYNYFCYLSAYILKSTRVTLASPTPTQHGGVHPSVLGGTDLCSQNGFKYYKDQEDEKEFPAHH